MGSEMCIRDRPRVPSYKINEYTYIRKNEESLKRFDDYLEQQDWRTVVEARTASDKVAALHAVIENGMASCFEHKTSKRKTSEPSWVSKEIRTAIRRRRAIFKREGRSEGWKRMKKITNKMIGDRRKNYNKEKKEKVLGADKNNFFKCINSFLNHSCLLYTSDAADE